MGESYSVPIRTSFEAYGYVVKYEPPRITILEILSKSTVYFTIATETKAVGTSLYTTPSIYSKKLSDLQKQINTYNAKFLNSLPSDIRNSVNSFAVKSDTHVNVEPELKAIRSQLDRIATLVRKL